MTIVIDEDGLEATNYTRPGHPSHAGKITRIVKQEGDHVVVETTGAGKLPLGAFDGVDQNLIDAVRGRLKPSEQPAEDAFETWKKDPSILKKKRPPA